jgi:hypothetical protein
VRARRVHPTTTAGATAHTPDHGSGAQVHAAKGWPVRGKTLGRLATGAASSARGLTGPGPSDAARPNSAQRGLTRAHPAAGTSAQMVRSSFPPQLGGGPSAIGHDRPRRAARHPTIRHARRSGLAGSNRGTLSTVQLAVAADGLRPRLNVMYVRSTMLRAQYRVEETGVPW